MQGNDLYIYKIALIVVGILGPGPGICFENLLFLSEK